MRGEDMYAYETFLINNFIKKIIFGIGTVIWMILKLIFDTVIHILILPLILIWDGGGDGILGQITKKIIQMMVIPVVESMYPVFNIEKKFDHIIKSPSVTGQNIKFADPDDETEMTQERWNSYIMYLNGSSPSTYDMFDILISQKIEKINFDITVAINRTSTVPRYLTYAAFYSKLKDVLGDAIDIQYRFTTNCMFVGIFGDQGPYRRFKYYDVI